jgi:23S rRNA pseudouridine1911/1915/1917 synthase
MSLVVLYEDNHLIGVCKPVGMVTQHTHAGDGCLMDAVKDYLREKYHKPGEVFLGLLHRLDRSVTGVVMLAKTSKGASRLSEQLRERALEKTYWALVQGTPQPAEGQLTHYHALDARGASVTAAPGPGRKLARLSYKVLRQLPAKSAATAPVSLVEVELETGRKHQIRLQLAAIGHPILGDRVYGARQPFAPGGIALVAKRVRFAHPVHRQQQMTVELPDQLCPLSQAGAGMPA